MQKLKIINNTKLSYSDIGWVIDNITSTDDTMYVGKKDCLIFNHRNCKFRVDITYQKTQTVWCFSYYQEGKI